jgi:hypothetical protein
VASSLVEQVEEWAVSVATGSGSDGRSGVVAAQWVASSRVEQVEERAVSVVTGSGGRSGVAAAQ